ncbi:MAG TPA: ABC transporter permease, partial [Candidatus Tumulicola sp.]|nr:ABC transporter permease [Candidatus Tumulicola sp.]
NSGRITFSERLRELGTLRILGYSRLDVTLVLAGEQLLLTLAAVPVGFLIGHGLNRALQPLYELEYYRVPTVVSNQTYVFACAFVLFAAGLSAAALALQVRRLDVVAALKAGE